MYNISTNNNTIVISDGEKTYGFPKGSIWLHTNSGDNESIDVKLAASRATIITFRYDDCNLAGSDSYQTLNNILQLL